MADILVVDDDQSIAAAFEKFLRLEGHSCTLANSADEALRLVSERAPDLVMMDVRMPGMDGLEALELLRRRNPSLQVVIMTAHGNSQTSIDAMRSGAFEYVTKPLDLDQLRDVIARATASTPADAGPGPDEMPDVSLVGDTPPMRELYKLIGTLAGTNVPALIIGERGTGKELVAATIHRNSARRDEPFVAIDCATLPPDVLDAQILSQTAGTLYLADVQDLPRLAQARLARMLGGDPRLAAASASIRVIASSERELVEPVKAGAFSRELFDLLSVITLRLTPLKARLADIPVLVRHLLRRFSIELNRETLAVDEKVVRRFEQYHWPGNVQELATVLKRAAIVSRGPVIGLDQVESSLRDSRVPTRGAIESDLERSTRMSLQERLVEMPTGAESSVFHDIVGFVEATLVKEALAITNGNQVKASSLLGVNRATLRKKAAFTE